MVLAFSKVDIIIDSSNITYWTDSTIVLSWINTFKPLKIFVSNRVAQILDVSSPSQWRYVPTNFNPVDLITIGREARLIGGGCDLWWNGPEWLCQEKEGWPKYPPLEDEIPKVCPITLSLVTESSVGLLDLYSNWMHLICITAWLLRFWAKFKNSL